MNKLLMTVNLTRAKTLAAAARKLGVKLVNLDAQYGLVEVDPALDLYAVQVDSEALPAAKGQESVAGATFHGPFSNPRIAPFGPYRGPPKR